MRIRVLGSVCCFALFFCVSPPPAPVFGQAQDLIVDICTAPNKYWNRTVLLKGHVIRVTPDPPGTNRGRYTLRDHTDRDIEVVTDDLPAQGKIYVVNGVVQQRTPGDTVPTVRETSRLLSSEVPAAVPEKAPETGAGGVVKPPAPRPPTPAVKPITKQEIDEAVQKELERRKAEESKQKAEPAPGDQAKIEEAVRKELERRKAEEQKNASPSYRAPLQDPWILGIGSLVVLAVVGILIMAMRRKPAPRPVPVEMAAGGAAPVAAAGGAPTMAVSGGAPTMAVGGGAPTMAMGGGAPTMAMSGGAATMVADRRTEAFILLGAVLTIVEGPDRGRTLNIGRNITTIGRAGHRKNDLELTDTTASREQAKIVYNPTEQSFKLVNESSTNPTRVNGIVVESVLLKNGDRIEFGGTAVNFTKS